MKSELILTSINIILYLAMAVVITIIIFRTRKALDWVFKVMLVVPLVLAFAAVLQLDRAVGVFSKDFSQSVFYCSRFIANIALLAALLMMLRISYKINKNEG